MRFLLLALMTIVGAIATAGAETVPRTDREAIEAIVRDVIRKNPEIIIEALEANERRRVDEEATRTRALLIANREALNNDPNSEVAGNPKGDITVVEFFDYRCPYCRQAHNEVQTLLKRDGKVRLVLKELPILGPESTLASRAAIASRLQGKYLPFHNAMLETRTLGEAVIFRLAADIGIDVERLKSDMRRPEVDAIITANLKLAHALGINGTPAFAIADKLLPGALPASKLVELVREAREACTTC